MALSRSLLLVSFACACTAPNPAFLAPLPDSSGDAETSGGVTTGGTGVTSGASTTTGPGTSMGGGTSTVGEVSTTADVTATVSSTDPPLTTAADSSAGETTGEPGSSSGEPGSSSGEPGSTGQPCMKAPHYQDGDGDGYGDPELVIDVCPGDGPAGWIPMAGDCNDADKNVHVGAIEVCNQIDDNCNGLRDEYSVMNAACGQCKMTEGDGHFYWACPGPKAPKDVHATCQMVAVSPGAKGYHAQITSEAEHNLVVGVSLLLNAGDVSIGLRDVKLLNLIPDHRWVVDESPLMGFGQTPGAFPWAIFEPSLPGEDWVTIRLSDKLWNDRKGVDAMAFVCEGQPAP